MQHLISNPFKFSDSEVRTAIGENNEPLFCAKDVCAVLDITWSGNTLENMEESWKGMLKLNTPGGEQDAVFINEAGLYHLVFRSNKPNAKQFASWVCSEVLPQLRKYGFYGEIAVKDYIAINKQIADLTLKLASTKNAFTAKIIYELLKDYCQMVNKTLPPIEFIRQEIDQCDLFLDSKAV